MRGQRRVLVLIFFLVAVVAGNIRAQDEGEYIADSGFRPADNGFSFQNYTEGYDNMTPIEMERLFGDVVCASEERDDDGACELTSTASMWMDQQNTTILGGHCEGMAALSLLIYNEEEDPTWFDGDAIYDLSLDDNDALQREIALIWNTWGASPTIPYFDVPSAIVNTLITTMNDRSEAYTLDIYMPDWTSGHAITPYAIADQGDGIFWIMVYDNNWPGEERHVEVDTNNETWSYSAATNPEEMEFVYQGDGTTQTMGLTLISGRLDVHECPFCGDADSAAGSYTGVVVNSPGASSTVTDSEGHVTGLVDGKFVNDIPGAKVLHPVSGLLFSQQPARIFVPSGIKFRVAVSSGNSTSQDNRASISFIRNGVISRVSNINLDDQEDFVDMDGDLISYTSSNGGETPTIEQGMTTSGNDYHYEITGKLDMSEGGTLNFSFDPQTGEFNIGGSDDNEYSVNVDRIDANGNIENFYTDNLAVSAGDSANLDAGEWQEGSNITGDIMNPDGSVEEPIDLTDEESPEVNPADAEATEVAPADDTSGEATDVAPADDTSGEATDVAPANDNTSDSQQPDNQGDNGG